MLDINCSESNLSKLSKLDDDFYIVYNLDPCGKLNDGLKKFILDQYAPQTKEQIRKNFLHYYGTKLEDVYYNKDPLVRIDGSMSIINLLNLANINLLSAENEYVSSLVSSIVKCRDLFVSRFQTIYSRHIPKYLNGWANVFDKFTDDTESHNHSSNAFNISGVYYVSGDFGHGNGDLFIYPKGSDQRVTFTPSNGKLLLFPSTLMHGIGRYQGVSKRISIAFDIFFNMCNNRLYIEV